MLRMPLKWMLCGILLLTGTVSAQQPQAQSPLRFSITPRGLVVRSGAPVDAEIEMFWNGTNLIEGRLEMTFYDHQRVVGRYLSDEMAISADGRKFSVMLPQMKNYDVQLPLDVIPRFITADGQTLELGEPGDFQIRVPHESKRAFVIAHSVPKDPETPGLGVLPFDALRVEQLIPDFTLGTNMGTTVVSFEPQDLPGESLTYFSYDLVVLAGEGFTKLNGKQLSAVAEWIEAGGSALIIPDQAVEPVHLEFLNRVSRAVPGVSELLVGKDGRLPQNGIDPLVSPRMSTPGLGRVVILNKPLDKSALNQPGLRRIVAFLWKVRTLGTFASIWDANWLRPSKLAEGQKIGESPGETAITQSIYSSLEKKPEKGKNKPPSPMSTEGQFISQDKKFWFDARQRAENNIPDSDRPWPVPRHDYAYRGGMLMPNALELQNVSYRPLPLQNNDELQKALTPSSIRAVPLSLVATVLALFLLVIGPGDYYLLGLLRARKYTWIFFPIVALGFTAFMVVAAQRHMGRTDYRNSLVVVDLGDTDKPVRTSRYELIFTATEKPLDTELNDMVYARFDPPTNDDFDPFANPAYARVEGERLPPDFPIVESRMPSHSVIHDTFPKWSPKVNRYTSLGNQQSVPEFDWGAFEPKLTAAAKQLARRKAAIARNAIASRETSRKDDSTEIEIEPEPDWKSLADEVTASFPEARIFLLPGGNTEFVNLNAATSRTKLVDVRQFRPGSEEAMLELIRNISAPPGDNLLYCVSQISPTGAGNFEDLALLDGTDPNQWLLLIVTRDKDDWIVYRRLYRNAH